MKHEPDLVVCDISMPRKNGHQLLREVRDTHPHLTEMPFIFLSALADKSDVMDGLTLGADDYITKPVDFDILKTRIVARLRQMDRVRLRHQHQLQNSCFLDDSGAYVLSEIGDQRLR